jgi:diphthamide biosynthesis protein 3
VITLEELDEGEDIAHCPSCTLKIRVIFEEEDIQKYMKETGSTED